MPTRQTLITIEKITDCDTGIYNIGEIDFGINGTMDDYIKKYGKEELIKTLSHLIYEVERRYRRLTPEPTGGQVMKQSH